MLSSRAWGWRVLCAKSAPSSPSLIVRIAQRLWQLRHVGRDPVRSRLQFTEALRLRELMWIASAFVFLDWYSTFLPTSRAVSPVPRSCLGRYPLPGPA